MKHILLSSIVFNTLMFTPPAFAGHEPDYRPGEPRAVTAWYEFYDQAAQTADLTYISGMRPHHAGALSMSEAYLKNTNASNSSVKNLARAIIHNQKYEISVLDHLENLAKNATPGSFAHVADHGMAQYLKFFAIPSPPLKSSDLVSDEDVRFAKAMIIHHEAAVKMAKDYLNNPNVNNGYLELMNVDIKLDQKLEIEFMQDIIRSYPGNADEIKITADMVHGMDHMMPHHMMKH